MAAPRDASTVIIARDTATGIELYMLRRSSRSPVIPDAYVFPGGTLDDSDKSPQARMRLAGEWRPAEPAFTYAAIRETFEECGILFAVEHVPQDVLRAARTRLLERERTFSETLIDLNVRLDARAIRYFSRWITPAEHPRVASTCASSLRARRRDKSRKPRCALETYDGRWIRPADALGESERDEIQMVFPTIKHLERVGAFATVDDLLAFAETKKTIPVTPELRAGSAGLPPTLENAW